jgi:hypothetical protein
MTREDWEKLSVAEKKAIKAEKMEAAAELIREGFPRTVRVKIGDFTMETVPSGVSENGAVSYSLPPSTITVGKYRIRINKCSVSVLAEQAATVDLSGGGDAI